MEWKLKAGIRRLKGEYAEQWACDYLQQQGLRLIKKNYLCKTGEIDLIMQHHNSLVFVEVRFRKNKLFGGALESVTPGKQKKLRLTAQHYLQRHSPNSCARFDVLAITGDNFQPQIEWIQDAF